MMSRGTIRGALLMAALIPLVPAAHAQTMSCSRTITADVVALEQVIWNNRFTSNLGVRSHQPLGMLYALKRDVVNSTTNVRCDQAGANCTAGNVQLRADKRPRPIVLRINEGDCLQVTFTNWLDPQRPYFEEPCCTDKTVLDKDFGPATRYAGMHVNGLQFNPNTSDGANVGRNTNTLVAPGGSRTYTWKGDKEGTFFLYSPAALAGGEGDGGSTVLGLFGAVNVEPAGSVWYRSQLVKADLDLVRTPGTKPYFKFDYAKTYPSGINAGQPVVGMLNSSNQLIYSDVNAIVYNPTENCTGDPKMGTCGNFREFTTIFHDEVKAVQVDPVLNCDESLHGARDGFGINYGIGGIGPMLLATYQNTGPAANCKDCQFEEFFLTSWANGDPALLNEFGDDPSNTFHSYMGDAVKFRNIHAGPFEHHVFHLHAHQWLNEEKGPYSSYLDSQTIGPGSAFTYEIDFRGSGNRNYTVGDSIFHCHLYPHFAQGMWALWRVHDVFEDGSAARKLPDGEIVGGTSNPAILPIRGTAVAPLPTASYRGYPFFMTDGTGNNQAAVAGRRPPQPPMDLVYDGGLPRHIVLDGTVTSYFPTEFIRHLNTAKLRILANNGTPSEVAAMNFHATPFHNTQFADATGSSGAKFYTNGKPAKMGAPFADPCPVAGNTTPDPFDGKIYPLITRKYRAAAIDLVQIANGANWHDKQARINVLNDEANAILSAPTSPFSPPGLGLSQSAADPYSSNVANPFFVRAISGECIEFSHTNLTGKELEEDDFQKRTATDTIGQHIHLVKFDVTASDGSANGFNYEDGTFAPGAVIERITANNLWPGSTPLTAVQHPWFPSLAEGLGAQTTAQRWWADPQQTPMEMDKTLQTVFTHDHFGASSIQQHGFYGALIVEPAETEKWVDPDSGATIGGTAAAFTARADGGPTQPFVNVVIGGDGDVDNDGTTDHFREFSLAFADFNLLYDANSNPINPPSAFDALGNPVPEVISTEDPGTMMINYRNDPIPVRLSSNGLGGGGIAGGARGDMANIFASDVHGRDPWTPMMKAYESDRIKIRLIQGSQEEQHIFNMHGFKWAQEPSETSSEWKNAQVIGISEHFEMNSPTPEACPVDRVISDAEMDELAWAVKMDLEWERNLDSAGTIGTAGESGLFAPTEPPGPSPTKNEVLTRLEAQLNAELYPDSDSGKVSKASLAVDRIFDDQSVKDALSQDQSTDSYHNAKPGTPEDKQTRRRRKRACFSDYLYSATSVDDLWNGMWGLMRVYRDKRTNLIELPGKLAPIDPGPTGFPYLDPVPTGISTLSPYRPPVGGKEPNPCPAGATNVNLDITAIAKSIPYNSHANISDPTGLIFVPTADVAAVQAGLKPVEPLVIRAAPGQCLKVKVRNRLPANVPDIADTDAQMPDIVDCINVWNMKPSRRIGMHPQLVDFNVRNSDGTHVGYNADQTIRRNRNATYTWYVPIAPAAGRDPGSAPGPMAPEELGATNLRDFGDVIKHGSQGLWGGLMLEPQNTTFPTFGMVANVNNSVGGSLKFKEFVLFYQDGLNLRRNAGIGYDGECLPDAGIFDRAVPDPCPPGPDGAPQPCEAYDPTVCRKFDPEDQGNRGWNYRTEPFWARLSPGNPRSELNELDQTNVLNSNVYWDPETVMWKANPGQPFRIRVVMPDGRSRGHTLTVSGHEWPLSPYYAYKSQAQGIRMGIGPMTHYNINPFQGAGGLGSYTGDYLLRNMGSMGISSGHWGILRVETTRPAQQNPAPNESQAQ